MASARADNPVVVEYVAPEECASNDAFHALLSAQIAQTTNPDRPWRFAVHIRHDGDYVGTLKTETGSRELRAPTCDEVTGALSLVIAMAQPDLPAPPKPIAVAAPPPPPSVVVAAPPSIVQPARDRATPQEKEKDKTTWRVGGRFEHWGDSSQLAFDGAFVAGGVEVPWGFPKMHFELGAGAMTGKVVNLINYMGIGNSYPPTQAVMGLLDAQACPIDLPLGKIGVDVMGCGRLMAGVAFGITESFGGPALAAWAGGGGRIRWQSPWKVFIAAHFDGLYGTRIEGVSALWDFGGSLGVGI
jgi:hypothetical protein